MPAEVTAEGLPTAAPLIVQLPVKPVVLYCVVRSAEVPEQIGRNLLAPILGFAFTVNVNTAVSVQPSVLLTINRYAPLAATINGDVIVTPPNVHILVKPVVVNWVVRFSVLPWQILAALSAPKFGFGLIVSVSKAVSEQLLLFAAIN